MAKPVNPDDIKRRFAVDSVNKAVADFRAVRRTGGATFARGPSSTREAFVASFRVLWPETDHPTFYRRTQHNENVTYIDMAAEVAFWYPAVYRAAPSFAISHDATLTGPGGQNMVELEETFHSGMLTKLVWAVLHGYGARTSDNGLPQELYKVSRMLLSQVVVPIVAYFGIVFNQSRRFNANKVMTKNVRSWEDALRKRVRTSGIWSNSFKDGNQTGANNTDLKTVTRGLMLPYALFATKFVYGMYADVEGALLGENRKYYKAATEVFTTADSVALRTTVLCQDTTTRDRVSL